MAAIILLCEHITYFYLYSCWTIPYMSGNVLFVFLHLSFHLMRSGSIYDLEYDKSSGFVIIQYSVIPLCQIVSVHSSVDGYIGFCHFLAIMKTQVYIL